MTILKMTIADLEKRGSALKKDFSQGAINEDEFRAGMNALRFQDSQNRWWMLGAQSNKWYVFDGARWLPGTPPEIPVTLPLAQPQPAAAPAPTPAYVPQYPTPAPPIPQTDDAPTQDSAQPITQPAREDMSRFAPPETPESVTQVVRRRRTRRATLPVWFYAGLGAIFLLIFLAAVLFAVDTFVAGKPITAFLGRTFGTTSNAPLPPPTGLPANVIAMITAGDQALGLGQTDTAIAQYQKAAQAVPGSSIPMTRLARVYSYRGQLQDAQSRARAAAKIAPQDAETLAQLCRALTWDAQIDEGIKACEAAIKLDSKNVNAHAFLTEAYLHRGRLADAKAQATLALQLGTQYAESHRAQAWVLTLSGQKDQALVEWNQTMTLEPTLFFRYYEAADVTRVFYNDAASAIPNYQRALVLNNSYLPAIINLGIAYLAVNQPQNAIPQLRRATTLAPNNVEVIANLGLAYEKSNQCSQAIPYFEQALKLDANNAIAQRGLNECKAGSPPAPAPAPPALTVPLLAPTAIPSGQ